MLTYVHSLRAAKFEEMFEWIKANTVFLLVADDGVELNDGLLLLGAEGAALDVRPQIVRPPQPAALSTPEQTCI